MDDFYFNLLTFNYSEFERECPYFREIRDYVNKLGGNWHFLDCFHDPDRAAYRITYESVDRRKVTLCVIAVGGKYPPEIYHF